MTDRQKARDAADQQALRQQQAQAVGSHAAATPVVSFTPQQPVDGHIGTSQDTSSQSAPSTLQLAPDIGSSTTLQKSMESSQQVL